MKHLRIYDNGGETLDRYTIVDMEPSAMVGTIDRDTLDSNLQRMLRNEFDHLNNIYTGEEQLRAMVTFSDGEVVPFTIVTKGRDKTPDCNISSTKMNIYFRTGYGKNRKQYSSLSQLKTAVTRKMRNTLAKEITSVDFALVDEVNIF